MRNEFLDEIGDTLFAVAVAGAIGLSAANLAVQVDKGRAAFDASNANHAQPIRSSGVGPTRAATKLPLS